MPGAALCTSTVRIAAPPPAGSTTTWNWRSCVAHEGLCFVYPRAGSLLEPSWETRYWAPPGSVSSNGDMFGFEVFYTEDPGNQIFLMSNSTTPQNQPRLEELMFLLITMSRGG